MAGITDNGFQIKSLDVILREQRTQVEGEFGSNFTTDPADKTNQLLGIFAEREAELWELALATYNSYYPDTARGVALDNVVSITGLFRQGDSRTTVNVYFSGTVGTEVSADTRLRLSGTDQEFELTETIILKEGKNEIQKISFRTPIPDGAIGSFPLTFNENTHPFNINDTGDNTNVMEFFRVHFGKLVSGTYDREEGLELEFRGDSAKNFVDLIRVGDATVGSEAFNVEVQSVQKGQAGNNETQVIAFDSALASDAVGTINITFMGVTQTFHIGGLSDDSSDPNQFFIDHFSGVIDGAEYNVTFDLTTGITIEFQGSLGNQNIDDIVAGNVLLSDSSTVNTSVSTSTEGFEGQNEIQKVVFTTPLPNGAVASFPLTWKGKTVPFNINAIGDNERTNEFFQANFASLVEGTFTVSSVLDRATGISFEFAGVLEKTPVDLMTVANGKYGQTDVALSVERVQLGVPDGDFGVTECTVAGPVQAPIGQINEIINPIFGLESVTNLDSGVVGSLMETDEELKARRLISLVPTNLSTLDSIRNALLDLNGVAAVKFFENQSNVEEDDLPPHSYEFVIRGGNDTEIAQAILNSKPVGITNHGSSSAVVTDEQGNLKRIYFSRPVQVQLDVKIVLLFKEIEGVTVNREAILNYFNTKTLGDQFSILGAVSATGDSRIISFDSDESGIKVLSSNVEYTSFFKLGNKQIAILEDGNLTINLQQFVE